MPRARCEYMRRKNSDAPFMWRYRISHPLSISRMMCITESNAISVLAI